MNEILNSLITVSGVVGALVTITVPVISSLIYKRMKKEKLSNIQMQKGKTSSIQITVDGKIIEMKGYNKEEIMKMLESLNKENTSNDENSKEHPE